MGRDLKWYKIFTLRRNNINSNNIAFWFFVLFCGYPYRIYLLLSYLNLPGKQKQLRVYISITKRQITIQCLKVCYLELLSPCLALHYVRFLGSRKNTQEVLFHLVISCNPQFYCCYDYFEQLPVRSIKNNKK